MHWQIRRLLIDFFDGFFHVLMHYILVVSSNGSWMGSWTASSFGWLQAWDRASLMVLWMASLTFLDWWLDGWGS
jgi:hypothetical protein